MIEINNVSKWYGPVQVLTDCSVKINKGGTLEGVLYAKAIVVEKGGIFSGELFIGQKGPEEVKTEQQSLFGDEGMQLKPA